MSAADTTLLAVHLGATAAMVGLIWFVQLVHYPLFLRVGQGGFVAYEQAHMRRTSWVVGPLMGLEVVCALAITIRPPGDLPAAVGWFGLVVLAGVHTSTVLLQVPSHRRLSAGFDRDTVGRLVRSNWIRTVGWSVRGVLAAAMVTAALP